MIEVHAHDTECTVRKRGLLTVGSRGIEARFTLEGEIASGMDVTACWKAGDARAETPLDGDGSVVVVPPELLEVVGTALEVGVFGMRSGRRIASVWAVVGIVRPSTADHHQQG